MLTIGAGCGEGGFIPRAELQLICCYNNDGEVFVGSLQLHRATMVRLLVPTKATDVVKGVSYLEQSKEQSFN
ncbi:hypothetical protein L6452_06008 [Arctium lappa]|uniref:Uncharacterized protein n=1 Tax=Arctium lappa TaxID=4217 RepID=A0ACB9EI17_ARCLA|nr:hypothetical protein L6452_06008 [Arctium lappa]